MSEVFYDKLIKQINDAKSKEQIEQVVGKCKELTGKISEKLKQNEEALQKLLSQYQQSEPAKQHDTIIVERWKLHERYDLLSKMLDDTKPLSGSIEFSGKNRYQINGNARYNKE